MTSAGQDLGADCSRCCRARLGANTAGSRMNRESTSCRECRAPRGGGSQRAGMPDHVSPKPALRGARWPARGAAQTCGDGDRGRTRPDGADGGDGGGGARDMVRVRRARILARRRSRRRGVHRPVVDADGRVEFARSAQAGRTRRVLLASPGVSWRRVGRAVVRSRPRPCDESTASCDVRSTRA